MLASGYAHKDKIFPRMQETTFSVRFFVVQSRDGAEKTSKKLIFFALPKNIRKKGIDKFKLLAYYNCTMSYNMTDERNAYTRDYPKETIANHVLVGSEACGKQRKVARHPTAQRGAIVFPTR